MQNFNESRAFLARMLNKSETLNKDYSSLTKEEKLNYFNSSFAKEIAKISAEETFKFSKVRTFKRETETTDENGNKTTKVNDNFIMDAISFAASIANLSLVQEFVTAQNAANRPDSVSVPYTAVKPFSNLSQEETIQVFESKFGRPENGVLSVPTGLGATLAEFLTSNGVPLDLIETLKNEGRKSESK